MCRDGKRASQTTGGTTTSCAYDANVSLPNILTDGTLKYVYGLGLAYAADSSGNLQVYHADGLGSVRAITNGSGAVTQTYTTDEFGVPSQTQGTSTQPFQFTGQQRDSTGLYYLRARMYDPTLGRFLQRDPLFGGLASPLSLNRFSYSMNNPVALVDPSGLSSNQATRDGSSDNDCFTTANGVFGGYVVNAACFDMPMGGQTVYALVDFPPPPHVVATVVFAKPGKGGGGGKAGGSSRDQMRAAGWTADQIISAFRRGEIRREFPGQYLGSTISEIESDAKDGVQAARKALKLLFDQRFMK